MKKNSIFFRHINGKKISAREELIIGTTKAVISSIDNALIPKTGRKVANLLTYIKRAGFFDENFYVGSCVIQYISGYAPGFTFVKMEDTKSNGWFMHARVFSFENTTISDDPLLIFKEKDLLKLNEMISGICLFGASGIEGHDEDGKIYKLTDTAELPTITKKIRKIEVKDMLHPYEFELTLRLTNFLSFFTANASLILNMHIPTLEYYCYGVSLYQKGLFDKKLLSQWFDLVDRRSKRIKQFLQNILPNQITLKQIAPLDPVKEYLHKNIMSPKHITKMLSETDISWKFLLNSHGELKDLIELSRLSYQAAYLQVAARSPLLISVEDPPEVKIWDKLKKTLKNNNKEWFLTGGKSISCIGLYIHPNTILSENGGYNYKSDMFSTIAPVTVNTLKEIFYYYNKYAPGQRYNAQMFQQLVLKANEL